MIWFLLPSDVYNEIKNNQEPESTSLIQITHQINKRKHDSDDKTETSII